MRLRQVNMFTARVRVGQRHFTALCGKAVCTSAHGRAATQSSRGTKRTGNFTCSLALICACADSSLAVLQHWIQSTLLRPRLSYETNLEGTDFEHCTSRAILLGMMNDIPVHGQAVRNENELTQKAQANAAFFAQFKPC